MFVTGGEACLERLLASCNFLYEALDSSSCVVAALICHMPGHASSPQYESDVSKSETFY